MDCLVSNVDLLFHCTEHAFGFPLPVGVPALEDLAENSADKVKHRKCTNVPMRALTRFSLHAMEKKCGCFSREHAGNALRELDSL